MKAIIDFLGVSILGIILGAMMAYAILGGFQ